MAVSRSKKGLVSTQDLHAATTADLRMTTMPQASTAVGIQPAPTPGALLFGEARSTPALDTHATAALNPSHATAATAGSPTDPLFAQQWHFNYLGDIAKIWEEYTGKGVHVGVYDDGMETTHEDLAANYDASLQVTVDGQLMDPNPTELIVQTTIGDVPVLFGADHGTAVSGLIAGARNGTGIVGVAYDATLTGVDILSGTKNADVNFSYSGFIEAVDQSENFDVINHSWGRQPLFFQEANSPGLAEQDAQLLGEWFEALENGRNGLGTVQVKAAGNSNLNVNGDAVAATRATIIVGAYDDDGDAAYYSNHGANLLVSAPTSGEAGNAGLVTTDRTGAFTLGEGSVDYGYGPGDYTTTFGGTSGATPIVTGVIALMMDANASLGWRDVQNILAYSAREVGSGVGGTQVASENEFWVYNGADNWNGGGLHFSGDYGYGAVDAYNAVRMAEVWGLFGAPKASANETSFEQAASQPIVLQDAQTTDIKFSFSNGAFAVDYVNIDLTISDARLEDFDFTLISPSGTEISLVEFDRTFYDSVTTGWHADFGANAFRGEDGIGQWTLRIVDHWAEDAGTIDAVKMTLHGTDGTSPVNDLTADVYHYTSEVFKTLARDASRLTLTDGDGGKDWIDASSLASNVSLNLAQGATSTAGGQAFLKIATGTNVENAVTGDGNDTLTGNALANMLYGMRGNDVLIGGSGADTLSGGAGTDTLTGGSGADSFLFDRALGTSNIDTIVDFSHVDDTILLDLIVFSGLSLGALGAAAFYVLGSGTEDGGDRIIYDSVSGAVYFDADGIGAAAAVKFAILQGGPDDLSFNDFSIVSSAAAAIGFAADRSQPSAPVVVSSTPTPHILGNGVDDIIGTERYDRILAKDANDRIFGLGGDDDISGAGGDDYIDGGAGNDVITAGDGDDWIIGGGSLINDGDGPLLTNMGENIYGQGGNDHIEGSNQKNDWTYFQMGVYDDYLWGGDGDDHISGFDGDDRLEGEAGNDVLVGGSGSDGLYGGDGDDTIDAGRGKLNVVGGGDGVDTLILAGAFSDYRFNGFDEFSFDIVRNTPGVIENDRIELDADKHSDIEILKFADRTIDLRDKPVVLVGGRGQNGYILDGEVAPDVKLIANGYETAAMVFSAGNVTITDTGKERGTEDRLDYVRLDDITGSAVIQSDALHALTAWNLIDDDHGFGMTPFRGSITVKAAAGDRWLELNLLGANLDKGERISDNTATQIFYDNVAYNGYALQNGAAVNDYNLSFASAKSFTFKTVYGDVHIKWNIPKVTSIDADLTYPRTGGLDNNFGTGNIGRITIDTPLDDSKLATAGGSAAYHFSSLVGAGSEYIRLGNRGTVNASNDGTSGEVAQTNKGMGLKGLIELGMGSDEARILGSGAFLGGRIDAGGNPPEYPTIPNDDVIRMTFGVAAAIGNISKNISGFEILQLDTTSLRNRSVDVRNFDDLNRVRVSGGASSSGDATINGLSSGATVSFMSVTTENRASQDLQGTPGFASVLETYGNKFGRVTIDLKGHASADVLNLTFWGRSSDGVDTGTLRVVDAETVNIVTDVADYSATGLDSEGFTIAGSNVPTDPFAQALNLERTTTVKLSGETGWDFTVRGSSIEKLKTLDASGVTGEGAVGAVIAKADARNVTFTGGAGDDKLTGSCGNDKLSGNGGADRLDGGSGNDKLYGDAGADTLLGGAGDDVLTGGAGLDFLTGGSGRDTFIFKSTAELGSDAATRDVITDFKRGDDKINLSGIDAIAATAANDAFHFVGKQAFHHDAGELHYQKVDLNGSANDVTIVSGDLDGNGVADFQIALKGLYDLKAADFVL